LTQYYCVFLVIFGIPVYYVLYHAAVARNIGLAILGTTMAAMLKLAWASYPPTWRSAFPTKRRAHRRRVRLFVRRAYRGLVQRLCLVGPQHPFVKAIEGQDLWLSPAVVLTIGSIMTFVSLLYSPETKDLELSGVTDKRADKRPVRRSI